MKKKSLEWGQTPWDDMSKDELLHEVWRMYSAMRSLYSVLKMHEVDNKNHPYFSKSGVGGNAIEKGRQILEPLFNQYENGESDIYRSFFRYADDLLFDTSTGYTMVGSGWNVCPKCGTMIGTNPNGTNPTGTPCQFCKEEPRGVYRLLTWEDLKSNT